MKKSIVTVTLTMAMACSFAPVQAESGSTQSGVDAVRQPPHMARMESELGLTEEQVQKMREIRDSGGSREDMRAVLTPDQQAKAAKMREGRKGDRGDRKAQIQQHLDLNDEQVEKMAEIRKAGGSRQDMRAVLTPEQQAKFDTMRAKQDGQKRPAQPKQEG